MSKDLNSNISYSIIDILLLVYNFVLTETQTDDIMG